MNLTLNQSRGRILTRLSALTVLIGSTAFCCTGASLPLSLHPENPHYFLFRNEATIIITSGEHYGAVLNLDFDYSRYLQTLKREGMNGTRTFAGAYCEPPGAFNIARNTLAPEANRFIAPWARASTPGYANGGNKFDLRKWDEAYFKRLKDFMSRASESGVIVEMNLFCPFYEESMWRLSPMNAVNNVNNIGDVGRTNVYTLDRHGGLLAVQEQMTRKIVRELKGFDNLYYEICNEPYFGGVTLEWQHRIAEVITETEKELGVKHLISRNVANDKAKVERPHPAISILNFHYATPPETVGMNYHLNRPIGDNETGFRGTNNAPYRLEAWDFIVAGGSLFNNLDYSFVAGHEDGTFVYPASQPGGGNPTYRKQLRFLKDFIHTFDFVNMQPDINLLKTRLPAGVTARALGKAGHEYVLYVRAGLGANNENPRQTRFGAEELALELRLPPGKYNVEWFDTKTGDAIRRASVGGGEQVKLPIPAFEDDIAGSVRVVKR